MTGESYAGKAMAATALVGVWALLLGAIRTKDKWMVIHVRQQSTYPQ
jgi:hypothetical protein